MPLSSLPTELDALIASFLVDHPRDLYSLTKVSTAYQIAAQPFLYESIHVDINDYITLRLLLLELIRRPSLASKIKSITATKHRSIHVFNRSTQELALKQETWDMALDVRDQINLVMCEQPTDAESIKLKNMLFCSLYEDTIQDSWAGHASLALIMLMAKNLQSLRICQPSPMLHCVLKFPWKKAQNAPFGTLTTSCLCACGGTNGYAPSHFLLPNTEHIKLMNARLYNWTDILHSQLESATPVVKTMHFQSMFVGHTSTLETCVKSPSMANLKQFLVQDYVTSSRHHPDWDMPALLRSLEIFTPKLEVFEWTNRINLTSWLPVSCFDTFQELKHLKHLTVDFSHIAPTRSWSDVVDNSSILLPDSLEYLTIDNVDSRELDHHVETLRTMIDNENAAMVDGAKAMPAKFPLKYLRINVSMELEPALQNAANNSGLDSLEDAHADFESMEDEDADDDSNAPKSRKLRPETVEFFLLVAEEFKATNTRFEVFRMPKVNKGIPKLLLGN
jgi:hypothetical protein